MGATGAQVTQRHELRTEGAASRPAAGATGKRRADKQVGRAQQFSSRFVELSAGLRAKGSSRGVAVPERSGQPQTRDRRRRRAEMGVLAHRAARQKPLRAASRLRRAVAQRNEHERLVGDVREDYVDKARTAVPADAEEGTHADAFTGKTLVDRAWKSN